MDAGDLLFAVPTIAEHQREEFRLRSELLFSAYQKIGTDAIMPGELDFPFGRDYLLSHLTQATLIASNIADKATHALLFTPAIIKEVGGVRVGMFGVMDNSLPLGVARDDVEVTDPIAAAKLSVAALKQDNAQLIVALSHLGFPLDKRLAAEVEGIDIIIGSHSRMRLDTPVKEGKTVICQAFERGQYLGRLDLTLVGSAPYSLEDASQGKKISRQSSSYVNSLVPMDGSIKFDPLVEKMVSAYKEAVGNIQKNVVAQIGAATGRVYRGESSCGQCHGKIVHFQSATRHARAYATLEKKKSALDPACVGCHTTGFGTSGGFTLPYLVGDMKNVQCEACHGPAKNHPDNPTGPSPFVRVTEETCRACHTDRWDPRFSLEKKLPAVSCGSALRKTAR